MEIRDLDPDNVLHRSLRVELGPGEAAALALAMSLEAEIVLIDERQGRMAAKRLGLDAKGTVGVLVAAKRQGHIERLSPLLEELVRQGAWISPALREAALLAVGEKS